MRRIDGPIWALFGAVGLGVAVRLVMLLTNIARFERDEAVTGVMAQRILHGDFPIYLANQSYQGALEQYLQAPILAILPDTPLSLRLVQLALSVVICLLVYVVATRVVGSRWAPVPWQPRCPVFRVLGGSQAARHPEKAQRPRSDNGVPAFCRRGEAGERISAFSRPGSSLHSETRTPATRAQADLDHPLRVREARH